MASHGVSRGSGEKALTDLDRKREQQKIKDYKALVESVNLKVWERKYDSETLELTSKLLKWNPEYYTIWNHRRLIVKALFLKRRENQSDNGVEGENTSSRIADELAFLLPLLRKFPKCYWIWNYRLWLLEEATRILDANEARKFWQQELSLAGKMLSMDSRNFMGWGYRRTVVAALASLKSSTDGSTISLTEQEFDYTTKMINSNLSNFSAWHNRSKLIPRLLDERQADHLARREFLDEELEVIQRALWAGSDDQSLWFYHQYLISTLDPKYSDQSMVPDLNAQERTEYLEQEIGRVEEMLDGAEDCKWIYQSLIQLSTLYKGLKGDWPVEAKKVEGWIIRLAELDSLREGRWAELRDVLKSL